MTAGYSGKPLIQKLGIKPGMRLIILHPPADYDATLGPLPDGIDQPPILDGTFDFIHFFTTERTALADQFPLMRDHLQTKGMIWISWPKKSAKIPTDLDENWVREIGLAAGLVDVKVCAVDERWSGLKFVFRLKDRPS